MFGEDLNSNSKGYDEFPREQAHCSRHVLGLSSDTVSAETRELVAAASLSADKSLPRVRRHARSQAAAAAASVRRQGVRRHVRWQAAAACRLCPQTGCPQTRALASGRSLQSLSADRVSADTYTGKRPQPLPLCTDTLSADTRAGFGPQPLPLSTGVRKHRRAFSRSCVSADTRMPADTRACPLQQSARLRPTTNTRQARPPTAEPGRPT